MCIFACNGVNGAKYNDANYSEASLGSQSSDEQPPQENQQNGEINCQLPDGCGMPETLHGVFIDIDGENIEGEILNVDLDKDGVVDCVFMCQKEDERASKLQLCDDVNNFILVVYLSILKGGFYYFPVPAQYDLFSINYRVNTLSISGSFLHGGDMAYEMQFKYNSTIKDMRLTKCVLDGKNVRLPSSPITAENLDCSVMKELGLLEN